MCYAQVYLIYMHFIRLVYCVIRLHSFSHVHFIFVVFYSYIKISETILKRAVDK